MILLRAIFWIAVGVVLIPRDPHLGINLPQGVFAGTQTACSADCQVSISNPAALREEMLKRIYQVKADLAAKDLSKNI